RPRPSSSVPARGPAQRAPAQTPARGFGPCSGPVRASRRGRGTNCQSWATVVLWRERSLVVDPRDRGRAPTWGAQVRTLVRTGHARSALNRLFAPMASTAACRSGTLLRCIALGSVLGALALAFPSAGPEAQAASGKGRQAAAAQPKDEGEEAG